MGLHEASWGFALGIHEASSGFAAEPHIFAMGFHKASRGSITGAFLWGFTKPLGALLWRMCIGASLQSFATGFGTGGEVSSQFPKKCLL